MQVLFVNSRPDALSNPGGDTVQVQKTAAALEQLGVEVIHRAPDDLEDLPKVDLAHVFNIQEAAPAHLAFKMLEAKNIPVVLSPIFWELYLYWFEGALHASKPWRVLAEGMGRAAARSVYLRWQRLKAPYKRFWRVQRELLQRAQRVLPNSNSEARILEVSFLLGRGFQNKVDPIPNAIDVELYDPPPAPSQSFLAEYGAQDFILQVGTINPVKNQLNLIEALFDLPVQLVFVGAIQTGYEAYGQACRQRAAERGNVLFIDHVPHASLPGIYALAEVHALPSWRETPGLVSLEAGAAGCKVVTTSIGSTQDYFEEQAWYCFPDDLGSIRRAVTQALAAPSSDKLRQRILNEYTWQRTAAATLKSYQEALT